MQFSSTQILKREYRKLNNPATAGENTFGFTAVQKITTTFLNLNLIDEYRLAVHPVIIGKGKPLFQNIEDKHKLTLINAKGYKSGVTLLTYKTERTTNS